MWCVVLKAFEGEEDLGVQVGSIANVFLEVVGVIHSVLSSGSKMLWLEDNLVLIVIGICNKVSRDAGERVSLGVS
jgi:hypothetical protein